MKASLETMRTYRQDEIAAMPTEVLAEIKAISFETQLITVTYFDGKWPIDGVTISIDDGYTFAEAMRTFLDHEPSHNANHGYMILAERNGVIHRAHVITFCITDD